MPGFISKLKAKELSDSSPYSKGDEQSFTIQPHPAKSNNPEELENPQLGAGLNSSPEYQAHHARGPHVPSQDIARNLEQPASREELKARSADLNK